jgi:hypothetical protein
VFLSEPQSALLLFVGRDSSAATPCMSLRTLIAHTCHPLFIPPPHFRSIVRSAVAFGIDTVFLGPGCTDPYSMQALRSTAGHAFEVKYGSYQRLEGVSVCAGFSR